MCAIDASGRPILDRERVANRGRLIVYGRHCGITSPEDGAVRRWRFEPSALQTHVSDTPPDDLDVNTIRAPSGDQEG
jgi:hypothetical protein